MRHRWCWLACGTMSAEKVVYLDSSAIVKLVVKEAETAALRRFLRRRTLVSSALARTEVHRAVLPHGDGARKTADAVLERLELLRINDRILKAAGALQPAGLRTLDAIHLASALTLKDDLAHVLCYDDRLSEAMTTNGLAATAPR